MRQIHNKQTRVNLLEPLDPDRIVPDEITDCFGVEYAPQDKDCSICSDIEICGIKYAELIKSKKTDFEDEKGPLLDVADMKGINMSKIEKLSKKYQEEGNPMTFEELQDVMKLQANIKDDEAIIQFIKRELPLTKMYLKEGCVYVR